MSLSLSLLYFSICSTLPSRKKGGFKENGCTWLFALRDSRSTQQTLSAIILSSKSVLLNLYHWVFLLKTCVLYVFCVSKIPYFLKKKNKRTTTASNIYSVYFDDAIKGGRTPAYIRWATGRRKKNDEGIKEKLLLTLFLNILKTLCKVYNRTTYRAQPYVYTLNAARDR